MRTRTRLTVREITVFAMLGAVLFAGKKLVEWIPNVHPATMLTMVYTLAYRKKGIIPVIVYLVLETVFTGGITWLVPYYYIFPLCCDNVRPGQHAIQMRDAPCRHRWDRAIHEHIH